MEKNNEKMSRPYVAPETEVFTLTSEKILAGFESGVPGEELP
jgi:hypothetical protein